MNFRKWFWTSNNIFKLWECFFSTSLSDSKMIIEDFEGKCARIYANAIANSEKAAKEMQKWVADKTNGARKFAAMNTLLMGAVMAKGAGIDSALALDVLSMAGFK